MHIRATNGTTKISKDNITRRQAMKRLSNPKQVRVLEIKSTQDHHTDDTKRRKRCKMFNYREFRCPVQGCIRPVLDSYDNLTAHIRRMHPESIHAVVLEAASSRTPIVLPSPPSEEEYRANFLLASTINASEGKGSISL